ncbi:hypothetical protein MTX25_10435 [Bradyrhizobium sp. ISRA432]|nr:MULTISPECIES: hypothetical protein [unclassified Bradyrhizobium]WGR73210.1 hypothetical protein MTX24_10425 [Bradyrhizobium sp. ISRA426]WGR78049.1 hypothetical protein MTX21_35395 [Bradyrhizobium sp. ISRA430]WGR88450.1 hypothetical protein MTX25_10435 [Bradyrhizobium sp. ISRA432]
MTRHFSSIRSIRDTEKNTHMSQRATLLPECLRSCVSAALLTRPVREAADAVPELHAALVSWRGALMHASVSGTGDYFASSEIQANAIARDVVPGFHQPTKTSIDRVGPEPPAYSASELYGIIPKDAQARSTCERSLLVWSMAADFKNTSRTMRHHSCALCAASWISSRDPANNGVPFGDSALKGAHFIQLCDKNRTPLLFLQGGDPAGTPR